MNNPMAKGSRLPGTEGVRVGVMPNACTILSMGTGEPDAVQVARPVRRGAGRKGGLADLARGLPYLVPRCGYRRRLKPGVRPHASRGVGVRRAGDLACRASGR